MENRRNGKERISRALSRAGVASRRAAEDLVLAGRVSVNGETLRHPAFNVGPDDLIRVDGEPVSPGGSTRLWRHHKLAGVVTTRRDERGRKTVFDCLPLDLPLLMPVGRLDLSSEGLLLLTNDGGLKRTLEHPSSGLLRRYRARVHGRLNRKRLAWLAKGQDIDGERLGPFEIEVDHEGTTNSWLAVSLRQGRRREIRRAMAGIGLEVNRLIRTSYGPFQLGGLGPGETEEVDPAEFAGLATRTV